MPNSNEKGAGFERSVCQRLSLWVSGMRREDVFWRSAMSGGRATLRSHRKDGHEFEAQVGDISAIHELGHQLLRYFVVECKFYRDFFLQLPAFGKAGEITGIWKKLLEECSRVHKQPFLVMKQNRQPELVCTTGRGKEILEAGIEWEGSGCLTPTMSYPAVDFNSFLFRDILTEVDFDKLRGRKKEGNGRVRLHL